MEVDIFGLSDVLIYLKVDLESPKCIAEAVSNGSLLPGSLVGPCGVGGRLNGPFC